MSRFTAVRRRRLIGAALGAIAVSAASASAATADVSGQPGWYSLDQQPLSSKVAVGVNIANGNLIVSSADVPMTDATYGVGLARYYNSAASSSSGPLGRGWTWDVGPQVRLELTSSTRVTLLGPSGYRVELVKQPDGSFDAPSSEFDGSVTQEPDGTFSLAKDSTNEIYRFSSTGKLTARVTATGAEHTVQETSGNGATLLGSFGTTTGRRINLSYDGTPRVIRTDDPASGHRSYAYDGGGFLRTFTDADNSTAQYTYNAAGRLSTVALSSGASEAVTYDSSGRVTRADVTDPGGVVSSTSYAYAAANPQSCEDDADATRQTTVTEGGTATTFCSNALGEVTSVAVPPYKGLDVLATEAEAAARAVAGSSFVGVWTDEDDHVRVGFTANEDVNLSAVKARVSAPEKLVGFNALRSEADLQAIDDDAAAVRAAGDSGILYIGVDTINNRVEVGAKNPTTARLRQLVRDHGDGVVVVKDEINDAAGSGQMQPYASVAAGSSSSRSRTAYREPVVAGLRIIGKRPEGATADPIECTSNFNVPYRDDTPRGIFTAGHCTIDQGQEWSQGGKKLAEVDTRNFGDGKRADAAFLDTDFGDHRHATNRIYLAPGRSIGVTDIQDPHKDRVGNKVCFSGATTDRLKCGHIKIRRGDDDPVLVRDVVGSVAELKSQRLATFHCRGGDSGAPVFLGHQAIGIVSAKDDRGCWFTHITHAQQEIGLSIDTGEGDTP